MKYQTLLFAILFCGNLHLRAETADSMKVVNLSGIDIVSTPKESGTIRQQPSAVSAISRDRLEASQVASLKNVSAIVPNFFMPDYGSRLTSAVYIRGVGSRINTPAVGLYVDNVPYVDKSAFDFSFYDIERVDVLRGPQATLYGRNAMGGIIKVYTKNPFRYQGTDVTVGYATGNHLRKASLTHYHRVSEKLAFSGSGHYEATSGFFKNDLTDKRVDALQSGGAKMRAIYLPSDHLKTDLTIGYDYTDEGAYPYFYAGTTGDEEQYPDLVGKISNNRENRYRRGLFNAGLNIEWQADKFTLNAVTGFQNLNDRMFLDQDFLSADIYTLEQKQNISTLTQEITLKSRGESRWQWLTGANLMYQWLHTDGPVTFYQDGLRWLESGINSMMPPMNKIPMLMGMGFSGMNVSFRGDQLRMDGSYETPTLGAAIFHQSTYNLTDNLSATLGLRLDYERQSMDYNSPALVEYAFSMPNRNNDKMSVNLDNLTSEILYKGKVNDDYLRVLPKFALKYDFNDRNNIYASVAMGQRSGGYNLQMFSDLLQGAMRVDMIDGVKSGVVGYLERMVQMAPNMPSQIPDPENPGSMISLPAYVERAMDQNMPQFETPETDQIVYRPEYSWNYELGAHLTLSDRLQMDAAVFYNKVYDQQIARFAPSGLGRMMVNAGKSRSFGGELSLLWRPVDALSLNANYGFTNAKFSEYDGGNNIDYSGNYVPFVPTHTANIDAAYTFRFKNNILRSLTLGATMTGAGKIYWTEDNMASQDFYSLLDARVVLGFKHCDLSLWGKNLTDTEYNTFYFESASRGYEQHGRPLQFGATLHCKF